MKTEEDLQMHLNRESSCEDALCRHFSKGRELRIGDVQEPIG